MVFCRGGTTVAGLNYSGTTDTNGNYSIGYNWNDDPNTYNWMSGLVVPPNQWSFVALVVTATNATIYVVNTNGFQYAVNVYNHIPLAFDGNTLIGDDISNPGLRAFNGTIDDVAVFNKSLSQNQLLNLYSGALGTVLNFSPIITKQPSSQTLYVGRTAQFNVVANGNPSPSYRWQAGTNGLYVNLNDGGSVSGSATPTLIINNLASVNGADYIVVITNTSGSVTSSIATLTVDVPTGGAYESAVLAANPIAYYELNETGDPATNAPVFDYAGGFNGIYGTASSKWQSEL